MSTHPCESCGLPIATDRYCKHCVDETGQLQSFDQRLERTLQFQSRQRRDATPEQLKRGALAYMATMPAWKDHPRIKAEFPDA